MAQHEDWLSVHDVADSLGLELSNDAAWSIGGILAARWKAGFGDLPTKVLRRKKCGVGSHCFAVYPPGWREMIAGMIKASSAKEAAQGSLL